MWIIRAYKAVTEYKKEKNRQHICQSMIMMIMINNGLQIFLIVTARAVRNRCWETFQSLNITVTSSEFDLAPACVNRYAGENINQSWSQSQLDRSSRVCLALTALLSGWLLSYPVVRSRTAETEKRPHSVG